MQTTTQHSSDSIRERLGSIYFDPSNEGSFGGIERLWKKARNDPVLRDAGISRSQVETFLHDQHTYSLHKQARRNFARNKTYVRGIDEQWQADLADMQSLAKHNHGFKYLLTVIDVFSKFAWVIPIKDKRANTLVGAFNLLFQKSSPRIPRKVQTDKGKEFLNGPVKDFLAKMKIHLFSSESDKKAAIVERFNRTLKHRIWRVFSHRRSFRYDDVLQSVVDAYNKSFHRSIGMSPISVRAKDENRIWRRLYGDCGDSSLKNNNHKVKKLSTDGQMVRISKVKGEFEKGYLPNWSEEHFHIDSNAPKNGSPKKVYKIKDHSGEEIKGSWYSEELQPIESNKYYIEKVIRTRKIGKSGHKELFVKWKGWPEKFNSWIPESNVE
jgi:hypothetical protein